MRFISIWGLKKGGRKVRFTKTGPSQWMFTRWDRRRSCQRTECATILNMVETCVRLLECNDERIFENFAMAGQRYFNRLEEMTVFTSRNFYSVCALFARTSHTSQSGLAAH